MFTSQNYDRSQGGGFLSTIPCVDERKPVNMDTDMADFWKIDNGGSNSFNMNILEHSRKYLQDEDPFKLSMSMGMGSSMILRRKSSAKEPKKLLDMD